MKIYNCDVCNGLVYFENTVCVECNTELGYLPILDNMSSLEAAGGELYKALAPQANGEWYKKCENYYKENVCNWMVPQHHDGEFCIACSFNDIIPDLSIPENKVYWQRLEIAKRRLIYSLLRLRLPLKNKDVDSENGLEFSFLADEFTLGFEKQETVLTGHDRGLITMNVNEANDVIREKMRLDMNERYRTVLGHFRHEIGHYYWFLAIENNPYLLDNFRSVFGDDRLDYEEALKNYYKNGAPVDWPQNFVSAYASAHPWEDWAESWAHYMHMIDTLETARAWGLTVKFQKGSDHASINLDYHSQSFEEMKDQWVYLSSALNSLNRSMGMKDVYPFVWSDNAIKKLHFIQQVIIGLTEG